MAGIDTLRILQVGTTAAAGEKCAGLAQLRERCLVGFAARALVENLAVPVEAQSFERAQDAV